MFAATHTNLQEVGKTIEPPMIHLVHVRDRERAAQWLRRGRRHIAANPVPLLLVGITATHGEVKEVLDRAGIEKAFIVDATGQPNPAPVAGTDVLLLSDREELVGAQAFIARAARARQRLEVILIEDVLQPDLDWCGGLVESFEALG